MSDSTKQEFARADDASRHEVILDSLAAGAGSDAALVSAVARQTRREVNPATREEAEILSVSCGVAAPVLTSYVLWTLGRAVEMGLKRLYFISRDGEVLLEIAKRLLPACRPGVDMELRYLWGSRQAWMLPSFAVSTRDLSRYLLQYYQNSSLKIIMGRVDLTLEDCKDFLPNHGFTVNDWERKLARGDLGPLRAMVADPVLLQRVGVRARESTDNVLGYLTQEGLFDDVSYGLVDLGWAGVMKGALERILGLRGKAAPPFFFFGRIRYDQHDEQSTLQAYQFNLAEGTGVDREWPGITWLMEMFCTSLSGGLLRYERRNDRYEPVQRQTDTSAVQEWGFALMRNSIVRFAENLAGKAAAMKPSAFLPPSAADALLKAFWFRPARDEARVWGRFPFEEDPSSESFNCLVPPLTPGSFWRVLVYGRGFRAYSEWNRGVIAAHSPVIGFLWLLCLSGYKTRKIVERFIFRRRVECSPTKTS